MEALAAAHDGAVQMIDTSVVRVHQHGACVAGNREQHMGRSRGGLTSKIHAVVDANGLPVQLGLTPGEAHDNRLCPELLTGLQPQSMLVADRGYDADWIRALVSQQGAWANIPPKSNRSRFVLAPTCIAAQPRRTVLQQDQAVSADRHVLRQTCGQLSGLRQTGRYPYLATRL
jgi:transposase